MLDASCGKSGEWKELTLQTSSHLSLLTSPFALPTSHFSSRVYITPRHEKTKKKYRFSFFLSILLARISRTYFQIPTPIYLYLPPSPHKFPPPPRFITVLPNLANPEIPNSSRHGGSDWAIEHEVRLFGDYVFFRYLLASVGTCRGREGVSISVMRDVV